LLSRLRISTHLAALAISVARVGDESGSLLYGSIIVAVALLASLIPLGQPTFPILLAVSSLFFAHAILRENLFNPPAELHRQLAEREQRLRTVVTGAARHSVRSGS
jgi:hypothetical protein